ncbi:hypothetical protein NUACC21_12010 [Scytonema sp. NUACC21]
MNRKDAKDTKKFNFFSRIQTLEITHLETLGEALLDFLAIEDLLNWLEVNQTA